MVGFKIKGKLHVTNPGREFTFFAREFDSQCGPLPVASSYNPSYPVIRPFIGVRAQFITGRSPCESD